MTDRISTALTYAEEHHDNTLSGFKDFLRIRSVSSMPEHDADMTVAAQWLVKRMNEIGMKRVEIFPTLGHPIVYGECLDAGADKPTVLIYGHYDVQKPDPLEDWNSDPFEPTTVGDNLYARGVSDNKGDIVAALAALGALDNTGGLPINVKLMFEGEEEVATGNLPPFLDAQRELLSCDFCLNVDGGMHAEGIPSIDYSLRGMALFWLEVNGPRQDIHSGQYGGTVQNPIHVLSGLIAKLHDENGRIAVPGIYDDVRPLGEDERTLLAKAGKDEAYFLEASGVPALWGDPDYTPVERVGARPTCEVLMFKAGEEKTAITASAKALISFRLVPDQKPEEIHRQFDDFIAANMPPTVTWTLTYRGGSNASVMDLDSPYLQTLSRTLETVWGQPPVYGRVGGGIPVVAALAQQLGIQTVLTGVSLPDDNFHGPNEKIHLPSWRGGIKVLIHYFVELAN